MGFDLPSIVRLFTDRGMFDSRDAWRRAGFEVFDRSSDNKIMVAGHANVPGVLFKKYVPEVSSSEQRENYERRVEGADRVRAFIKSRGLRHVTTPRKQLHTLPSSFSRPHVLVVERLALLDDDETKDRYERIDKDVLRDLCVVIAKFRGLDSWTKNLPFTTDGKIAFIDTEHWDRSKRGKRPMRQIDDYLRKSSRKYVRKFFDFDDDDYDDE